MKKKKDEITIRSGAGGVKYMGLLDLFKRKKHELTDEEKRWNKLWDMWSKGAADSPYAQLMTYQSEINNGGHEQYFYNTENSGDLQKEMSALKTVLSETLSDNLQRAYQAYLSLEENEDDEKAEAVMEQCDDLFFENEEEINRVLEEYAARIEL